MRLKDAWDFYGALADNHGIILILQARERAAVAGGGDPCGMDICDDFDYFFNYSNEKEASPLVEKFVELENQETLIGPRQDELGTIIWNRFYRNWAQRYKAYFVENYEQLDNYSMTETVTPDLTHTRTPNLTQTETPNITHTRTPTLTDLETPDLSTATSDQNRNLVHGFNSTVAVDTNQSIGGISIHEDGTRKTEHTGHETNTETGTRAIAQSGTETTTDTGTTRTTRSGNIGVTTSQQMLQSELDLRAYDYVKSIYADIDTVLCCPLYA